MKRLVVSLIALVLSGCTSGSKTQQSATEIPVTTRSEEARQHFVKGRDLSENVRPVEASEELAAALKLDDGFASARALLGFNTNGADGLRELERASEQAAALPEAERAYIDGMLASRRGDVAKSVSFGKRLVELLPSDFRSHIMLARSYMFVAQDYEAAAAALQKAVELNPRSGPALNELGYAMLRRQNAAGAIDAFQKYVAVMPQEPNAQDSLGEALLAAGRFADAETAFRKAAELSPRFWNAWEGVAYAKFYAGDYAGGRDALNKALATAERPGDKVAVQVVGAMAALADRKSDDALKALDAADSTAGTKPNETALVPVSRALVLLDTNKTKDALAELDKSMRLASGGTLPPGATRNVRRLTLEVRSAVEARMKDTEAAQKTAAMLQSDSQGRPDDKPLQASMHFAQGMAALASGDREGARTHWAMCSNGDVLCEGELALLTNTQPAVRRASAAPVTPAAAPRILQRDGTALYLRSREMKK